MDAISPVDTKAIVLQFISKIIEENHTQDRSMDRVRYALYFLNKCVGFAHYRWHEGRLHSDMTERFIACYRSGSNIIIPLHKYSWKDNQKLKEVTYIEDVLDFLRKESLEEMRLLASVDFWRIKPGFVIQKDKINYIQEKMAKSNSDYKISEDRVEKAMEKLSKLKIEKVVYMPIIRSDD